MFMILIRYQNDGKTAWEVYGDEVFKTEEAARIAADLYAQERFNVFAIVETKCAIRRTVQVVQIEKIEVESL